MATDPAEIDRVKEEGAITREIIPNILVDGATEAEEDHEGNNRLNADNIL
jgi:hypothetical protein